MLACANVFAAAVVLLPWPNPPTFDDLLQSVGVDLDRNDYYHCEDDDYDTPAAKLGETDEPAIESPEKPASPGKGKPKPKIADELECLAVFVGSSSDDVPKGKAKGKAKPRAPALLDASGNSMLRSTGIFKHRKGGRTTDHSCDNYRREIAVPVYGEGIFKGMWKINPVDTNTVTPQTTRIYNAFLEAIEDERSVKQYTAPQQIGHPWFPEVEDSTASYLFSITITNEQHFAFWDAVCGKRANVANKQQAVNKLVNMAGFSQDVLHGGSGKVMFTFDNAKWHKQCTSLLRNGVGGGGNSTFHGRPSIVVALEPGAAGGSA